MIKSYVNLPAKEMSSYPKIMKCLDPCEFYVLFTNNETGTVIQTSNTHYPIGYYSCCWCLDRFEDTDVKITLQNI